MHACIHASLNIIFVVVVQNVVGYHIFVTIVICQLFCQGAIIICIIIIIIIIIRIIIIIIIIIIILFRTVIRMLLLFDTSIVCDIITANLPLCLYPYFLN